MTDDTQSLKSALARVAKALGYSEGAHEGNIVSVRLRRK